MPAKVLEKAHGVVPRIKQIVCVGEFRATQFPDYFSLIREQGSRIEVELMRPHPQDILRSLGRRVLEFDQSGAQPGPPRCILPNV